MEEPVKGLAAGAIAGAAELLGRAEEALAAAVGGAATRLTRPMPLAELFTGRLPGSAADLAGVLEVARDLVGCVPKDTLWLPYLGDALDAGVSAALSEEVILAATQEPSAFSDADVGALWERSSSDARPPLILVLGEPPSPAAAASLYGDFAAKDALALAPSTFAALLADAGVEPDPRHLATLGADVAHAADVFGLLARMARLAGVPAGDVPALRAFAEQRIFAFIMVLGALEPVIATTVAAGITFGMSSVGEAYIPQLLPIHSLP